MLVDDQEMGNKGSVDITPVKLSSYGDKGPQAGAKKGRIGFAKNNFHCWCRLLITFANSLDPDQARQNV